MAIKYSFIFLKVSEDSNRFKKREPIADAINTIENV